MPAIAPERFRPSDLIHYATALFAAAGCDGDKPATIAAGLVEADLLGHTTHGLALAPAYLRELESGAMTARGEPDVVADRGPRSPGTGGGSPASGSPRRPLTSPRIGPPPTAPRPSSFAAATTSAASRSSCSARPIAG